MKIRQIRLTMWIEDTTATLMAIPDGKAGVAKTLRLMRGLIRNGKTNMRVYLLTRELIRQANLPQKAYRAEVAVLHAYVRDKIRYIRDIDGVETLHTPEKVLELGQGDCDDKAILLASMLGSIGHKTQLVAVGFQPGRFSHVYVETKIGSKWVPLETTEPWPMGKAAPGVMSKLMLKL